jgi:nucleoside-diphosphate-sugar epimerase
MNILITGSNGYVGNSLLKALSCYGYNVVGHTRQMFDLQDQSAVANHLKNNCYDVVIHAAASGGSRLKPDSAHDLFNNLMCFNNLYDNRHRFKKLITFGSGAEFKQELSPYSLSKRSINAQIQTTPNFYNLRIYAVFDENELETRFIKNNLLRYINKQPLVVHQNKFMDFFAMVDLAEVVRYCCEHNNKNLSDKIIDCCYDKKYSLLDIVEYINSKSNHTCKIHIENEGMGDAYTGFSSTMPIVPLTGILQNIDSMYTKLINKP